MGQIEKRRQGELQSRLQPARATRYLRSIEELTKDFRHDTCDQHLLNTDLNRPDDLHHILRSVGQVITASLETVRIVEALPGESANLLDVREASDHLLLSCFPIRGCAGGR